MTFEPVPDQPVWMRVLKLAGVVSLVVLAGFAVVGAAQYLGRVVAVAIGPADDSDNPVQVEPGQSVTIDIPIGSTGQDIGAILAARGVVRSALEFEVAVRNVNAAQSLQAGTYGMKTLMDPGEVVAMLVAGPGPDVYRVTIIEGLRVEEMLVALAEKTPHEYSDFEDALLGGEVSTSLREMPIDFTLADWEGLLFPDTYEFTRTAQASSILQRMASIMEQRVNDVDWSAWKNLGYTEYEGIIVASLIETEVLLDVERPIVSGVIHNRLAAEMKLDIDAAVLYALGTKDVTRFDNEVDSPYNTYLFAGLPPTPIASPGRASLEAAAAPDENSFFYYVRSSEGPEGSHAFAETLEEHINNVNQAREDGVLP